MSGKVFNELFGTRESKNVKESETKPTVQTDTASQWKLMESVPVPLTRLPKELLENEKEKAKLAVSTGTSTADQIDGERSDLQFRGKEHENGSGSRKEGERQVEEERTQEEVAGSTQEDQRSEIPEEEKGSGTEEEGSGIQDEKRKQENVAGSGGHDVTTMSSAQTLNSKETTENIQIRMQNASLSERNATSETKQKMAGDVVDAGVNQNGSQVNDRLSTSVKGIPLSVYGPLCLMLNVKRDVKDDDFRMLAEKVGLNRDETNYIEQLKNPTNEILKTWSKKNEATVGTLIDILKGEHLERMDAVKLLEDWVNQT